MLRPIKEWVLDNVLSLIPDKAYLKLKYRVVMHKKLNLNNPKTFNEKLQWLKLYNRKPEYTTMVDKYAVKEYVASKIGESYIIPTLGVWDKPEDIDWDSMPNQFVLKTTHGGGNLGVVVVKDKLSIDKEVIIQNLKKSMKLDLYKRNREWPYKNVPKRILAEAFLEDKTTQELRDYKFFCFDGKVKALFIATDRQTREEPYFNFFDGDFNSLDFKQGHPRNVVLPEKPSTFEKMKEVAATLSKGIPHVRVDLYEVNGRVYFGEMTFFHFGGIVPFEPEVWDYKFGEMIKIPMIN
ncbi:MAG: glycosyl transferase [Bacteroidales bacterium]|nr:glycosyl transferase [Bacteroidales bacterium]